MSNDRSGFPGIAMAVTHVVWVVSGGEKTHWALAPVAANAVAATAPDRHASSLDRVVMEVFSFDGCSGFEVSTFPWWSFRSSFRGCRDDGCSECVCDARRVRRGGGRRQHERRGRVALFLENRRPPRDRAQGPAVMRLAGHEADHVVGDFV